MACRAFPGLTVPVRWGAKLTVKSDVGITRLSSLPCSRQRFKSPKPLRSTRLQKDIQILPDEALLLISAQTINLLYLHHGPSPVTVLYGLYSVSVPWKGAVKCRCFKHPDPEDNSTPHQADR